MKKLYQTSLFLFHRDLRLYDNNGLRQALQSSDRVIPCFIADPVQVGTSNGYRGTPALEAMFASLFDLEKQLRAHKALMYIFYGKSAQVLENLLKTIPINAIFCNKDYTPFSINRDAHLAQVLQKYNSSFIVCTDTLLNEPEVILKKDGTPYSIFSAFYKKASINLIAKPQTLRSPHFYTKSISGTVTITSIRNKILPNPFKLPYKGGRTEGLKILNSLKQFVHYNQNRNYPYKATTGLSVHLKFGTLSIRETYHAIKKRLGPHHVLLKQLYWRDFFTHIAYHSPPCFW